MLQWGAAYICVLIVFGIVDMVWLSAMGNVLYRPILGEILAEKVRLAPAVIFYLFYPVGLATFAIVPALRETSPTTAAGYGALFGALAYATYGLTNHAVMKNWTSLVTGVDIAYGALASGFAALTTYFLLTNVFGLGGSSS